MGDCLVVLLNDDDSVRRLKGFGRPIQPLADRLAVLSACRWVDLVIVFGGDTPAAELEILRPAVLVKGADWAGREIAGAEWCGEVRFVGLVEGVSTSETARRAAGG